MALNHLRLHVADVARSRAFYETYLGFRLPDAGSVRRLGETLAAGGHDVVETGDEDDLVWCRARDPDGYAVEVYWE